MQQFSVFNGPNYLSRSKKLLDVGSGARSGVKNLRCLELEPEI